MIAQELEVSLHMAFVEARQQRHEFITVEHLLLALLNQEDGGTASLLACTNWVESEAWDGRWAVCVCTDVCDAPAQYPFMNGAACVAMLVGADAPLALEGRRRTHMAHAWDFHKPVGWPSMGPIIDGPGSMELYHKSLAACQVRRACNVCDCARVSANRTYHLL